MSAHGKPGAVTPGPWDHDGQNVFTDTRQLVCCGRGRNECCGDPDVDGALERIAQVENPADADLFVDAGKAFHATGKTPSEMAAEVATLTAQLAEVREQRDYYRGLPAGAEVERLTKDRDALLGAAKLFVVYADTGVSDYDDTAMMIAYANAENALRAAIHQCEGAKA